MTLLEILKSKNMTQKDLAKRAGITEATLSRYLHHRRRLSLDNVVNISIALGISVDEFIKIYYGSEE